MKQSHATLKQEIATPRKAGLAMTTFNGFLHGIAEGTGVFVGGGGMVGVNVGRGVRVGTGVLVGRFVRVGVGLGGWMCVGVTSTSLG